MSTTMLPTGIAIHIVLKWLSQIYQSPYAFIGESVDNGADAGANNIWIVLEKDNVTITDNGNGMVKDMLESDKLVIEKYLLEIRDPVLRQQYEGVDIRSQISTTSKNSIEWMVGHIAWSPKTTEAGPKTRGYMGIGWLSYRNVAKKAVWLTKPSENLAISAWGEDFLKKGVPTILLIPPHEDQLDNTETDNEVVFPAEKILTDPLGNELDHGTKVVISEFHDQSVFRTTNIADYLSMRFSEDIRTGRITLTIIDNVTSQRGIVTQVKPSSYHGKSIFEQTRYSKGGKDPWNIKIFWSPRTSRETKSLLIQIQRKGANVGPLTAIEDFNVYPWNSKELSGYIQFPDVSESDAVWNTQKTLPIRGVAYNHWINSLTNLTPEIIDLIAQEKDKVNKIEQRDIAQRLEKSIIEALGQLDSYSELGLNRPKIRSRSEIKKRKLNIPPIEDYHSYATVLNEHGQPIPNIKVDLLQKGKRESLIRSTGVSGVLTYEKLDPGSYTIRLIEIPDNMKPMTDTSYKFEIRENLPRVRITFRLFTNTPKPQRNKIPGISIWAHPFLDPKQIYSINRMNEKDGSILEVNTSEISLRTAIEIEDHDAITTGMCLAVAMGITEYAFGKCLPESDPFGYLNSNTVELFNLTLRIFNEGEKHKRRPRIDKHIS